jgi:hypothetical protein
MASGRRQIKADRNWAHGTVENSALGCSAQPMEGKAWQCPECGEGALEMYVCSLPSPLGLSCILPYFAPFVYYLMSRERLYDASILRVIELSPTQLMSDLGSCNSTTCKTNAGHHRSGSESGAVQCGARNGGGLASSCVTVIE